MTQFAVSLRRDPDRRLYPVRIPPATCLACKRIDKAETMRTVDGRKADLTTLLQGRMLCLDEEGCLRRAPKGLLHLVVETAEARATGSILLITDNPRRALTHAARQKAAYLAVRIEIDYRES